VKPVDLALHHAALGRDVFPIAVRVVEGKRRKVPQVRWTTEASSDPDRVRAMWRSRGSAMTGWRLPPGLVVADVDDWDAFEATGLELPEAPRQETPSGGTHLLYRYQGAARQTVKQVDGLDTRIGGRGIVVLYGVDSFVGDPPDAPDWLLMPRDPSQERDFAELGTRQEIVEWLGSLARAGQLTEGEASALLAAAYQGGRIVDRDPSDPWPRSFPGLAAQAADWSRRDAPDPRLGGLVMSPLSGRSPDRN
jgi:hypothetical protein